MLFYKLAENFDLPVDIVWAINKPNILRRSKTQIFNGVPMPIGGGGLCWQYYDEPKNILFLRNWTDNIIQTFIVNKLKKLQFQLSAQTERNELIDVFLSLNIIKSNLVPIKVVGEVSPHIDVTRNYSLTIGVKNSNLYRTYASNTTVYSDFKLDDRDSYTINDGDVYITKVNSIHAVKPINLDNCVERLTMSYNITG